MLQMAEVAIGSIAAASRAAYEEAWLAGSRIMSNGLCGGTKLQAVILQVTAVSDQGTILWGAVCERATKTVLIAVGFLEILPGKRLVDNLFLGW